MRRLLPILIVIVAVLLVQAVRRFDLRRRMHRSQSDAARTEAPSMSTEMSTELPTELSTPALIAYVVIGSAAAAAIYWFVIQAEHS